MPVSFIRQRRYVGPGDIVSGATAWYGLRGYSAAYAATGTGKAVNVRRASDNATQDIVILTSGALDIASANTFATVDATANASTTGSSTTVALTSASSTPHVGSTITGSGVVQPCYIISVGSFTAGAGTIVVNQAQNISVSTPISMQYALFIPSYYDQSGNGANISQVTAANQPQLLPNGGTAVNSKPVSLFAGYASVVLLQSTIPALVSPVSASVLSNRPSTSTVTLLADSSGNFNFKYTAASTITAAQSTSVVSATASDNAYHSLQSVLNGASSGINVDGAFTTGTTTARTGGTTLTLGSGALVPLLLDGVGIWNLAFTPTQYGNLHTNDSAYYGTP